MKTNSCLEYVETQARTGEHTRNVPFAALQGWWEGLSLVSSA